MNFKDRFIPIQYIYSDWLFIWFLLYISPLNPNTSFSNTYYNPLYSLYLALFANGIMLAHLFVEKSKWNVIAKMFLMMVCEKIIPIYILLSPYKQSQSLHFQNNIPSTLGLFFLYLTFLHFQNTNFYEVYESITYSIKKDDNNTPFFLLFHTLFGL